MHDELLKDRVGWKMQKLVHCVDDGAVMYAVVGKERKHGSLMERLRRAVPSKVFDCIGAVDLAHDDLDAVAAAEDESAAAAPYAVV